MGGRGLVALLAVAGCATTSGGAAGTTGGEAGSSGEPSGSASSSASTSSDPASSGGDGSTDGGSTDSSSTSAGIDDGCEGGPPVHCVLESLTAPYIDTEGSPGQAIGLVVGVQTSAGRYVTGFGATEPGGDTPPAPNAMLELASIGKVYTGYLLADALQRREVALTDTLENTFGPAVPTFEGQSIDLLDLATHTSALPDYPTNVPNPGPINPMDGYTLQMLETFFASHELPEAPGTSYVYSNLGSGTLGYILTQAAGVPDYPTLAQQRIAQPRGFVDTVVDLDREQQGRWMQMYQDGNAIPPLAMGEVLYGGGILRSTADEVLDFFGEATAGDDLIWDLVLEPRRPGAPGSSTGFQIAVEDLGDRTRYSKGGASAGMVMFTVDPPVVVYVQTNVRGIRGLRMMAAEILDGIEDASFDDA